MRLLVIGANGQLARSLASLDGNAPDLTVITRGRPDLDIENPGSVAVAIDRTDPDVVVNAAAYTAVDAAEGDQMRAFAINAAGAGAVALATATAGLPLIHISTDYVFDGTATAPYTEDDAPNPRSVYGRSKLAGEAAVANANPDHAILRTAWVYSPWGANFVKTMLRLAGERGTIRVVGDQYGNPTYAPDLAAAIVMIARQMLARSQDPSLRGIFHLIGPDEGSWCDFAREIMLASSALGGPVAEIVPIETSDYPTAAARPANSRLDSGLIRRVFHLDLPPRPVSLARCVGALLHTDEPNLAGLATVRSAVVELRRDMGRVHVV